MDGAREHRRLLVVDDEVAITELVGTVLRYEGFEVRAAATGREAIGVVEEFHPDLVVLDVMLPDFDGFEVQRRLAGRGVHCPILFLSARDSTEDKVRGLSKGADDYVTKPFSLEELVARVHAVLRRSGEAARSHRIAVADLELDDDTHEVFRSGAPIALSPTEFSLLRFLLVNSPRVVTKAQILDHVWRYDFGGDQNVVETYISYLRKKIDLVEPKLVQTIRGVGYSLRPPAH